MAYLELDNLIEDKNYFEKRLVAAAEGVDNSVSDNLTSRILTLRSALIAYRRAVLAIEDFKKMNK